jgi:cephalosporin hydroxylase
MSDSLPRDPANRRSNLAKFVYSARYYGLLNSLFRIPLVSGLAANAFHRAYYHGGVWTQTYWRGIPILKCPLDLWVYQEILYETKPDLIIETGTNNGGSAHFLGSLFDLSGNGRIITIDLQEYPKKRSHPRAQYLLGSSVSEEILQQVRAAAAHAGRVMVILDSDHSAKHVLAELEAYHSLVTPGCYLVVEDSNVNAHPVHPKHGAGPMEAMRRFLKEHPEFQVDMAREKFGVTFNPRGYLRRI